MPKIPIKSTYMRSYRKHFDTLLGLEKYPMCHSNIIWQFMDNTLLSDNKT